MPNRRTEVTTAYGTAEASTEISVLTPNGQQAWVRDAELNRTSYIYDGHDWLSQTRYPVATKGADASSTTDYEALTYDAASNVLTRRLRDNQSIGYSYDFLNRPVSLDGPNVAYRETDRS